VLENYFGTFYKTTFAGLTYLGLHIKFGVLSLTNKKVMPPRGLVFSAAATSLPPFLTQSVTTLLFVNKSPPNFVFGPI